jgi:hypothetical protein
MGAEGAPLEESWLGGRGHEDQHEDQHGGQSQGAMVEALLPPQRHLGTEQMAATMANGGGSWSANATTEMGSTNYTDSPRLRIGT